MRTIRFVLLVTLAALLPVSALAFDINDLRINGFISQGYMKTFENNWLATDSVDGTFQLNEVGLTLTAPVTDKLRIGMQLLSRDLGDEGNNEVRLDWAFGDYRVNDSFGLRLGKVKMPIGLYNEGRDSDFLRQMAFLPQSTYDETRRNLLVASQGLQVYGNVALGAAGDVDYAAHYGQINFPSDSPTLQAFLDFANMGGSFMAEGPWNQISADNKYVYGGQLRYNTPLDGLRLAGSYFEGQADFAVTDITGAAAAGTLRVEIRKMYVASLEYATPWFTFSSEYTQFEQPAWLNGMKLAPVGPSGTSQGLYGMLTVPVPDLEQLSLTFMYDVYYRDKDDRSGGQQSAAMAGMGVPMPDYYFFRKDAGLAARYDINQHWLIKAEYHKVNGADLLLPFFNNNMAVKHWDYYIVKTSFNF